VRLSPVTAFFLKVLAWMPVTFSLWYFSAEVGLWPVTQLVDGFLSFQIPYAIQSVTQVGHQIQVSVYLAVPDLTAQLSAAALAGWCLRASSW
jgi:hypothetical protein